MYRELDRLTREFKQNKKPKEQYNRDHIPLSKMIASDDPRNQESGK